MNAGKPDPCAGPIDQRELTALDDGRIKLPADGLGAVRASRLRANGFGPRPNAIGQSPCRPYGRYVTSRPVVRLPTPSSTESTVSARKMYSISDN
jgi:hypothetical protein